MGWEDLTCPICLDFPHNAVLLKCVNFEKGCQPFVCDALETLSNCLEWLKISHGMQSYAELSETRAMVSSEGNQSTSAVLNGQLKCPLCRGDVLKCVVVEEARDYLNKKIRSCQDGTCTYSGNFTELQKHTKLSHPHAHAIVVDPTKLSEWEHLQQASAFRDVLSILHMEEHNGSILGDYTVEYGDSEDADEYVDFPGDDGECWTSTLLNEVSNSFGTFRNQGIASVSEISNDHRGQNSHTSHVDGSTLYANVEDAEISDSMITIPSYASVRRISSNHRSRRRRWNPRFTWPYC